MKKLINLMRVFALLLMLAGVSSSAWATAYLKGTFNNWGETNAFSNGVCKVCLGAKTTYEFKVNDGSWYGADGTMDSTNCANWILYENTGNTKIQTVKSGEYTFKWDSSSKKLSVTYPTTELSCSGSTEDEDSGDDSYLDAIVCDPENTRIIFEEHFNAPSTVTSLNVKSRWGYTASGNGYTAKVPSNYTPMTTSCTAIKNAGSYAVLVNPFYAGCGEQTQGDTYACDCNDSQWYKNITDHTGNGNGGMLFYNCKDGEKNTDMLYECTVDVCAKTFINFSAYIASATAVDRNCNVKAKVRFLLYDAQTGAELSRYTTQDISLSSGNSWTNIAVMFNSQTAEKVTLKLQNLAAEGCGNDLLLDDITFSVCTPKADLKCSNGNTQISVLAGLTETLTSSLTSGLMDNPYYLWQVRNPLTRVWINLIETPEQNIPTFTVTPDAPNLEYRVIIAPTIEDINNVLNDRNSEIPCGMYAITNNVTVNVELKDLVLTSSIANAYICVDGKNENTLTLKLENPRLVDAKNVIVTLDNIENLNITKRTGLGDYANGVWTVGTLASNATATIELKITSSASVSEQTLKVISAYVSNVDAVSYESYLKAPEGSKKQSNLTLKPVSDTPVLNRPGEDYAYNMCKTENTEKGKETDPNVIDNKYLFKDYLILAGEDKSGLVWLDMNGNKIPDGDAFFYADKVQDEAVKLYRDLEGSCPSDTIEVRYRVKEITKFTEVGTYKECPIKGDSIPLSNYVKGEKEFKYLFFKDESNQDVKKFDPSVSGVTTYTVKASYDEINSLGNNYCEADTTITITIKEHATAANIMAKDTTVCPGADLELIAKADFAKEQTNVKLTWYPDTTYKRTLAYGETFKYHLIDTSYKVNPDTVYVTIQSDDYCENIPSEAKPVVISQMEAVPALAITPESTEVVIGATPGFTVTPDDARYDLYVNDVKVSSDATTYKPYLDSEYKLVYEGDCGSKTVYANVSVQWPTVFTPYVQDGRNDTFVKDMDPNFYTQIFTRFGTKIYEGDNGWDGKVQGAMNGSPDKIAVPGVYYYVVQLPDGNVKKGTIEVFKY